VTGLTWAPVHAATDLAAAVARCQAASAGDEATIVLTLHVTSGPAAALAARFDAVSAQACHPGGNAADGQHRRGSAGSAAARSGVTTSKLTFVCVAALSADEATATTAGRRGLSNLRSRVMGDGAAASSGDKQAASCQLSYAGLAPRIADRISVPGDGSHRQQPNSSLGCITHAGQRPATRRGSQGGAGSGRQSRMGGVGGGGRSAAQRRRAVRAVPPVEADAILTGHAARIRCEGSWIGMSRSGRASTQVCVCHRDSFYTAQQSYVCSSQEQCRWWSVWIPANTSGRRASPPSHTPHK